MERISDRLSTFECSARGSEGVEGIKLGREEEEGSASSARTLEESLQRARKMRKASLWYWPL